MNVLVTGAKGQLGKCVRDLDKNPDDFYIYTDIEELDICNSQSVKEFIGKNNIEIVINCAAYTNVDKAEEPDELTKVFNVNAVAPGILAEEMKRNDGVLIHISTDYVFGGNFNNTPCTEDQQPNPTGIYGKSKLEGERNIEHSGCKSIILRTAWLYSEYGKNFVKTMLDLTSRLPELKVVFDQCGTPTYARDLARAILDIVNNRKFRNRHGIYHFSNEGVCSWYDFTKEIQRLSQNNECNVKPCHSSEFPSKVNRPAYSVLDKTKYKKDFECEIPYWTDSLKKCIGQLQLVK